MKNKRHKEHMFANSVCDSTIPTHVNCFNVCHEKQSLNYLVKLRKEQGQKITYLHLLAQAAPPP